MSRGMCILPIYTARGNRRGGLPNYEQILLAIIPYTREQSAAEDSICEVHKTYRWGFLAL